MRTDPMELNSPRILVQGPEKLKKAQRSAGRPNILNWSDCAVVRFTENHHSSPYLLEYSLCDSGPMRTFDQKVRIYRTIRT